MILFPTITFSNAEQSFQWLEGVLGAERVAVFTDDQDRVVHAEIRIGDTTIMGGDDHPGGQATPVGVSVFYLAVEDVVAAHSRADAADAKPSEVVQKEHDSREFTVIDPDGNTWTLGTYTGAS